MKGRTPKASALAVLLLSLLCRQVGAQGQAVEPGAQEALSYLDGDAAVIVSLRPSQLQAMQEQWVTSLPEQKGASDLAALGAIAILGFHPLQTNAWQAIGIDTNARIWVQLAAIDRQAATAADRGAPAALWRSRIILPVSNMTTAVKALSNMRVRDRVKLSEPEPANMEKLLDASGESAQRAQRRLVKAGVFMMGRPAPMGGLLIASTRGNLVIIDWIAPYGPGKQVLRWSKSEAALMAAITRRPKLLHNSPAAEVLTASEVSLWLNPSALGTALSAAEVDGLSRKSVLRRHRRCEPFRKLATRGDFNAIGAGLTLGADQIDLQVRWFLREPSELVPYLFTAESPRLLGASPIFEAHVHLAALGSWRSRQREALTSNWDLLWNKAKACGRGSKAFALAVDWPTIAGLFLDELSALDPSADTLIDSMGPFHLSVLGRNSQGAEQDQGPDETVDGDINLLRINAEAWVRKPGNAIAKRYLLSLFGSERRRRASTSYGFGAVQPYAIDQSAGSIIGAGLRPQSREWALRAKRRRSPASSLIEVSARPARLVELFPELPWLGALRLFADAHATLRIEGDALHLHLRLAADPG